MTICPVPGSNPTISRSTPQRGELLSQSGVLTVQEPPELKNTYLSTHLQFGHLFVNSWHVKRVGGRPWVSTPIPNLPAFLWIAVLSSLLYVYASDKDLFDFSGSRLSHISCMDLYLVTKNKYNDAKEVRLRMQEVFGLSSILINQHIWFKRWPRSHCTMFPYALSASHRWSSSSRMKNGETIQAFFASDPFSIVRS